MDILKSIEHEQLKNKIPELKIGNTVRVHVRIKEGNKERIQVFEGIIIKKQGGGVNETFTVRRISYGVGVEKTFLVHSPRIEKVEVVRVGKAAKTKEKIGARIETKEIIIKEEVVPGETEVVETVEDVPVVEAPEEEVKAEEKPATEAPAKEEKAEVKEEVKTEAKAEEKKEELKEEPAKEEKKSDKKAE